MENINLKTANINSGICPKRQENIDTPKNQGNEQPQIKQLSNICYKPIFKGSATLSADKEINKTLEPLPIELKEELDSINGHFETYIHPTVPVQVTDGTIKDFINDSLSGEPKEIDKTVYHVTSKNAAKNIVKTGFDFDRYGSIKTGPGIYFTNSPLWGQTMVGNSETISSRVTGTAQSINSSFYNKIIDNKEVMNQVKEKIKELDLDISPSEAMVRYVREIIRDEMGLDLLTTSIGGPTHYVVYNPDSISGTKIDSSAKERVDAGLPSDYYRY